jgi:DNA-binding MarR family transcriptional regulator
MVRQDLGAMFARITQRLVAAERPILARHGLSMWAYIALSELARHPADTQLALANAIGYDKTRLVTLLDGLEHDSLLTRSPDPADRRGRIVALTDDGERRLAAARTEIRTMETAVLRELTVTERRTLLAVLPRLASDGHWPSPGEPAGRQAG